jgi:hypothetical protein
MGYLITYLLLALAFDLIRELLNPDAHNRKTAVRRRLWSDTEFDCCSNVFAVEETIPRKKTRTSSVQSQNLIKRFRSWIVRSWKAENFV